MADPLEKNMRTMLKFSDPEGDPVFAWLEDIRAVSVAGENGEAVLWGPCRDGLLVSGDASDIAVAMRNLEHRKPLAKETIYDTVTEQWLPADY